MKTPNFFILGAQKSGTTFLAAALAQHRDIFFSNPKEPLFFQRPGLTATDYNGYLKQYFGNAKGERWIGEGSTVYLQWPPALEHIKQLIPGQPRFIVCLRQPTEKAVSFFIHNWRRGRYEPGTTILDTLTIRDSLSITRSSLYADSIDRWFGAYPREHFCFIDFNTLQTDAVNFVRTATEFLQVDPLESVPTNTINEGVPLTWQDDVLVTTNIPSAAREHARFTADELAAVQQYFKDDIERTETLTGLDLSHWKSVPDFS